MAISELLALVGLGCVIAGVVALCGVFAAPGVALVVIGIVLVLVAALIGGRFRVRL